MNVARPSDGLLGAAHTTELLRLIGGTSGGSPLRQMLKDFSEISLTSRSKTQNTIRILEEFGILTSNHPSGTRGISPRFAGKDCYAKIQQETVNLFINSITAHGRESCIHSSIAGNSIELDSFLLPGRTNGSLLWLLEFGIAIRTKIGDRFWTVASEFSESFVNCVVSQNDRRHPKGMALTTLKKKIEQDGELGREAEEWVLGYEKRRLSRHVLIDHIRRVSDEDVSAGYDLVSFSALTKLAFDRFIEVKSYSHEPRFFWSKNEIEKAKKFGERYILMLVEPQKDGRP